MGKLRNIVCSHLQGRNRKRLIQQHRMYEFEKALDLLFKGKVDPMYVKERADKMKEINRI